MPEFRHPPTVEVLQSLIAPLPFHLIVNLQKSVRLWYALSQFDGDFQLETFTDIQWRDRLFLAPGRTWDNKANPTDGCICTKTIEQIIGFQLDWQQWKRSYLNLYSKNTDNNKLQENLERIESSKPFNITQKTLKNDLTTLVNRSYLSATVNIYTIPMVFPELWTNNNSSLVDVEAENNKSNPGLSEEFMSFADLFWQPLNKVQRFYIHADYECSIEISSRVSEYRKKLADIWDGDKGSPCKLIYKSSSKIQTYSAITYPVCIYYYQRAFYLCAFGTNQNESESNWHNYRLDRIEELECLGWDNNDIPSDLRAKCEDCEDIDLIYDDIYQGIADAYGFDINLPIKSMLLRFDRNFHDRYITNTLRHHTFKAVNYEEIDLLIQERNSAEHQQIMARIRLYPNDAYYKMNYRVGDNSVIIRLRAWCPNVEVLLPFDLRDRMREDIQKTWNFYKDDRR